MLGQRVICLLEYVIWWLGVVVVENVSRCTKAVEHFRNLFEEILLTY